MLGRRFGIELELNGGAQEVVAALYERRLIGDDSIHDYHCGCEHCDHWRGPQGAPFTAQHDCTVAVELISRVLRHGAKNTSRYISALATCLMSARAVADATSGDGAGNHVHVDMRDLDNAARVRLLRLFGHHQDELGVLASGPDGHVRGYNRRLSPDDWQGVKPDSMYYGCHAWLSIGPHQETAEFRLWNSTRAEWRLRLHSDVSVALVNAAADGADIDEERSLVDVISPYVTPETFGYLLLQSTYAKG